MTHFQTLQHFLIDDDAFADAAFVDVAFVDVVFVGVAFVGAAFVDDVVAVVDGIVVGVDAKQEIEEGCCVVLSLVVFLVLL